jgi:positive regulator of sigma E activity
MTEQQPSFVPGIVLAHVTLRVIVPLLGGVIAGLVADGIGQTAPLFVLIGMAVGTTVSVLWLRAYIVSGVQRLRRDDDRAVAAGAEEHEQSTTEGNR